MFNANMQLDSVYNTISLINENDHTYLFSLQHVSKLNDHGAELTTQGNYIYFKKNQQQGIATTYRLPDATFIK